MLKCLTQRERFLFSLLLFSMRFSLVKLDIFYLSQVRLPGVIDGSGA